MDEIKEMIENSSRSLDEVIGFIDDSISTMQRAKNAILDYTFFCDQCGKYYYKHKCPTRKEIKTKLECTNPYMGYLEPYEYEKVTYWEYGKVCPEGHQVEKPKYGGRVV